MSQWWQCLKPTGAGGESRMFPAPTCHLSVVTAKLKFAVLTWQEGRDLHVYLVLRTFTDSPCANCVR